MAVIPRKSGTYIMGSLLGTQFFLVTAVTKNITHLLQKSLKFKEIDLRLIFSAPHQAH